MYKLILLGYVILPKQCNLKKQHIVKVKDKQLLCIGLENALEYAIRYLSERGCFWEVGVLNYFLVLKWVDSTK